MKTYVDEVVEIFAIVIALAAVVLAALSAIPSVGVELPAEILLAGFGLAGTLYALGKRGKKGASVDIGAVQAGGRRLIVEFQDGVELRDFLRAYGAYQDEAAKDESDKS
jgi:hypothetical protein